MRSQEELERVVREHYPLVKRICRDWLARFGEAEAEDAVQDVFERWLKSPPLSKTPFAERAWLIRCAKNRSADIRRKLLRERGHLTEMPEEPAAPEDMELGSLLERQPPEIQLLLRLHYGEGFTWAEIARILHTTEGAVKMKVSRAKQILREQLQEENCNEKTDNQS